MRYRVPALLKRNVRCPIGHTVGAPGAEQPVTIAEESKQRRWSRQVGRGRAIVAAAGQSVSSEAPRIGHQARRTSPAAKIRPPRIRALPRERLTSLLSRLAEQRVLLVVAPAGSGKTTLLAQLAAEAEAPVAWYWAESSDAPVGVLVERLEQSFAAVVPTLSRGWTSAEDIALALEAWPGPAPLLVIDDFHVLQGSPAESTLERLLAYAPTLRVLIASRALPGFNVSRLRVSGDLLEIDADDLRFRSWEVDRLFRDFYGEPLPPDDLALLSRRTDGWAAALQLFHLATRGKPAIQRRRILATLSDRSKLMREYLARNVIDELSAVLRDFMVQTSVLGRLSAPLCDEFLERTGSDQILEDLQRRQLFTCAVGDENEYRYHEILRSHLEVALVEDIGEVEARAHYQRAGTILESAGIVPEALHAFCRAEDWNAVRCLVGREGEQLVDGSSMWIEAVPPAISRNDPWLLLAAARRCRAAGRFQAAVETYQEAERAFGAARAGEVCRRERLSLKAWLDPAPPPSSDWLGLVRQATIREPMAARQTAARELAGPERGFAGGIAALLAGNLPDAIALLRGVAEEPGASDAFAVGARAAVAVAHLLAGDLVGAREAELAAEDAERLELPWLAWFSRAALALSDRADGRAESASARVLFKRRGDPWGSALATLMEGWGALAAGRKATTLLRRAVDEFQGLGAEVLETWARAVLSIGLARAGARNARQTAVRAEASARSLGVPGAQALAYAALAETDSPRARDYRALAAAVQKECSLTTPGAPAGDSGDHRPRSKSASVVIRCFGVFSISIRGVPIDLSVAKPRARKILRLLALHAGRPVHREVLVEALWPDADPQAGNRSLHVAVSSLRRVLEAANELGAASLIARDGEAYRLALPADAWIDLVEFDRTLAEGRAARVTGDVDGSIAAYQAALDLHAGELLPEDGPAEWLVRERDRRSAEACNAAHAVAEMLLERNDPAGAAAVYRHALRVDRYRDDLWRLRIGCYERAGDVAAAVRSRREYEQVLAELGLTVLEEPGDRSTMVA